MIHYKCILVVSGIFTTITSCSQPNKKSHSSSSSINISNTQPIQIDTAASTPVSRFSAPTGYIRMNYDKSSFQYYLSHFPLKAAGTKVYYYDGRLKSNQGVSAAVFDIDAGTKDLQQCADAIMRLRAEYLYEKKKFNDIHFELTNGFRVDYSKWRMGYRVKVAANNTSWYKATGVDDSYKCFKSYLEIVFSYAGTLSLSKELHTVSPDSMQVGDIFIHGGSPGHAVILVDLAINPINNKRIFIIAQSYMPAQDIHLLVNDYDKGISPWYDLSQMDKLYSPEWTFEKTDLKRF